MSAPDASSTADLRDELTKLREELRQKDDLLRVLFDANPDGIAIADAKMNVSANEMSAVYFDTSRGSDVAPEQWAAEYGLFSDDGKTPYPLSDLPLVRAIRGETINDDLGYQHSWDFANDGRLTVRVQTHYESSKNLDYHNFAVTDQDAYTKTDLMVTYDAPGGAWSLMAYGRNLEDEAVLVQAAPDAQNANRLGGSGAYAPPRLYGVQLTARF